MDSENEIVASPITHERRQTPTPAREFDTETAIDSSPLPSLSRHGHSPSIARKRPNQEIYGPVEHPKSSPTGSRFQRSVTEMPGQDVLQARNNPFERHGFPPTSQIEQHQPFVTDTTALNSNSTGAPLSATNAFVKEIHDYQQSLELEFQEFEQRLNERDTAADLETMDWADLETRYGKEIQPHIIAEQEVMNEFSARFQVL